MATHDTEVYCKVSDINHFRNPSKGQKTGPKDAKAPKTPDKYKYHKDLECGSAKAAKNRKSISLSECLSYGMTQCSRCKDFIGKYKTEQSIIANERIKENMKNEILEQSRNILSDQMLDADEKEIVYICSNKTIPIIVHKYSECGSSTDLIPTCRVYLEQFDTKDCTCFGKNNNSGLSTEEITQKNKKYQNQYHEINKVKLNAQQKENYHKNIKPDEQKMDKRRQQQRDNYDPDAALAKRIAQHIKDPKATSRASKKYRQSDKGKQTTKDRENTLEYKEKRKIQKFQKKINKVIDEILIKSFPGERIRQLILGHLNKFKVKSEEYDYSDSDNDDEKNDEKADQKFLKRVQKRLGAIKSTPRIVAVPDEMIIGMITSECMYCGFKPTNDDVLTGTQKLLGIDRLDNSIYNYTPANILPCCTMCNYMKRDTNLLEFLLRCLSINDESFDEYVFFKGHMKVIQGYDYKHFLARTKSDDFKVDMDEKTYNQLTSDTCHYCGIPNDLLRLSLDRKDNTGDTYNTSTVVASCVPCNLMKRTSKYDNFLSQVHHICKHLRLDSIDNVFQAFQHIKNKAQEFSHTDWSDYKLSEKTKKNSYKIHPIIKNSIVYWVQDYSKFHLSHTCITAKLRSNTHSIQKTNWKITPKYMLPCRVCHPNVLFEQLERPFLSA